MQIRPLHETEKPYFAKLIQAAFVQPPQFAENWLKGVEAVNTRGLFDEQDRLVTALRIRWNELWLGQKLVKMVGITNVVTPPEERRKGHLKTLLYEVMRQERDNGYNLSALYPFEFPFYKKFGYELASDELHMTVSMAAMKDFNSKHKGEWIEQTSDNWQSFQAIYNEFCKGKFGRIDRPNEGDWLSRLFTLYRNGVTTTTVPYLWYDETGKARAYIFYHFDKLPTSEWDRKMVIDDMAWLDETAHHEIYAFLAQHDSQAIEISWRTQPCNPFTSLLSDPREAERKLEAGYMLRLLDVERALVERSWPMLDKPQKFSLAIHDDGLEWNDNKTYHLELDAKAGQAQVAATNGTDKAGLECDVRTLTQFYAGYLSPKTAAHIGKLKVHNPSELEAAQQIFWPAEQPASFMADFW